MNYVSTVNYALRIYDALVALEEGVGASVGIGPKIAEQLYKTQFIIFT